MKTTTTVTTQTEVTIAPKVAKKLQTELHGYALVTSELKALEEAKRGHSDAVLQLAIDNVEGDKFALDGFKVAVVRGAKDSRLDKDALVKRLVGDGKYSLKAAQALLEDCTRVTSKRDHVRISVPEE